MENRSWEDGARSVIPLLEEDCKEAVRVHCLCGGDVPNYHVFFPTDAIRKERLRDGTFRRLYALLGEKLRLVGADVPYKLRFDSEETLDREYGGDFGDYYEDADLYDDD